MHSKKESKLKRLGVNDGFGPQPGGATSIAEYFDDESAIMVSLQDKKEQLMWDSIDNELKTRLAAFKTKVTKKTAVYKFETLMLWLEHTTVLH